MTIPASDVASHTCASILSILTVSAVIWLAARAVPNTGTNASNYVTIVTPCQPIDYSHTVSP